MVQTLQLKRGTSVEVGTIIPAVGEPVYDREISALYVGDGITSGGKPITTPELSNYAALRAYTGHATAIKIVDSFRSGRFRKVSTTSTGYTDDGGITIIGANGWVWQRINVGEVHVDWYLPQSWVEGVTDDTTYILRACQYRSRNGGGTVRFFRRHLIDNDLHVSDYVHLKGALEDAEELLDGVQAYSSKASTLVINPSKTVYLYSGTSLSHALLIPKGMTLRFPDEAAAIAGLASFAGTAVTARGAGVYFHDSTVWGFNLAFSSTSLERPRIERIKGDCNNGIYISRCFDIADVSNCHFWPWLTTHRGFNSNLGKRPGAAYKFYDVGDWNRLTRNFSFGYERGFVIDSCDNVELINCGADHIAALDNTTSVGFEITGTSKNTTMVACQAAAQWRGVWLNTTATNGQMLQMNACQYWGNDSAHVKVSSGFLQAVGNAYRGAPVGIDFDAASLGGVLTANRFDGTTTPVTGTLTNVSSELNTYVNCVDSVLGDRKVATGHNGNFIDALYAPLNSRNHITRRAGGTPETPVALGGSAAVVGYTGSAYNGSTFSVIAGLRFQTSQPQTSTSSGGTIVFSTCSDGSTSSQDRWVMSNDGAFRPVGNATQDLAGPSNRINNSYFAVAPTVGSDERYKTTPQAIPDIVLDAWAAVEYQQYKLLQAVEEKGEDKARLHVGLVAQRVVEAFASFGLDARDYGLLCHDSWEEIPEIPETLDEEGNVITPRQEKVEASERYSIRYEEALVMEAALMRRTTKRLEDKISLLTSKEA